MRCMHADPEGRFVHQLILESCQRFASRTAIVDSSTGERVSYAEYGSRVEQVAKGLVASGVRAGERVAIDLPNCWEFCVSYHATTLIGAVPTMLNPSYREREVRYQVQNSGAATLITDAAVIKGVDLGGLPELRRAFTTRNPMAGMQPFSNLLRPANVALPKPTQAPSAALAALPYSSGTSGLPKGVMLTHHNLVSNIYQFLDCPTAPTLRPDDVVLCVVPLYHIYGLNVWLNPALAVGATVVIMPRFEVSRFCEVMVREQATMLPLVPPIINTFCQEALKGTFPRQHSVRWVNSGGAPLAPELPRRFTDLTSIPVRQGFGMTEASPVTHQGFLEPDLYQPDSIGRPVAATECMLLDGSGCQVKTGEPGELVLRGPQFMLGYWNAPQETAAVLRDGCYWSGDLVRSDHRGFYYVVDRLRDMIKFKGFPIAPAEVESVLLEHPAVQDCGVTGRPDEEAGQVPHAYVVLRESYSPSDKLCRDLIGWVADQLTKFKQPHNVEFVQSIPRSPSGKILRRNLGA